MSGLGRELAAMEAEGHRYGYDDAYFELIALCRRVDQAYEDGQKGRYQLREAE